VDTAELLLEWARGWAVSRGRPKPTAVDNGLRIHLGRSDRYVTTEVPGWLDDPGIAINTEIKVLTEPATLQAALDNRWLMFPTVELMTSTFTRGRTTLPPGYARRVSSDGATIVAELLDHDTVACSARLAPSGGSGIVDKVDTLPHHGHRGLATAALTILGNWATAEGLRTGILSATDQGAPLYRRLGWAARGPIAGAILKRPSPLLPGRDR
jgi:hypothetical protein